MDGLIPLNDDSSPILKDALAILSSKVGITFLHMSRNVISNKVAF